MSGPNSVTQRYVEKTTMAATTPVLFRTGCQLITPGSASTIVRGSLSTAATGTRNTDRMDVSTTRQTSWQSCMPQLTKARLWSCIKTYLIKWRYKKWLDSKLLRNQVFFWPWLDVHVYPIRITAVTSKTSGALSRFPFARLSVNMLLTSWSAPHTRQCQPKKKDAGF